jgi:hypothetical protein
MQHYFLCGAAERLGTHPLFIAYLVPTEKLNVWFCINNSSHVILQEREETKENFLFPNFNIAKFCHS